MDWLDVHLLLDTAGTAVQILSGVLAISSGAALCRRTGRRVVETGGRSSWTTR